MGDYTGMCTLCGGATFSGCCVACGASGSGDFSNSKYVDSSGFSSERYCDSCGAGLGYGREDISVCSACLLMLRDAEGCASPIIDDPFYDEDDEF